MSILIYILIGGILFILISIIFIFNSLVSLNNSVKTAWSGIDIQLKRRANLIPNLINTVKGYTTHEKELFENIAKIRTSMMDASKTNDVKNTAKNANMLNGALKSLFAVSESYPDLKANQNFMQLQEELTETEDQISAARRIYNSNVKDYNIKIESFPPNIIARRFNFIQKDFFEIEIIEDRKNPTTRF